MAGRTGRPSPATNSREDLLEAWMRRHKDLLPTVGVDKVRQRIKTHVGLAADWFPDIERGVAIGRGRLVGWKSEPVASTGSGVDLFGSLLDRVAPLAIAVYDEGRRTLAGGSFERALTSAGVPDGPGRYTIGYYRDPVGGGSRIFAAVSDAIAEHIRQLPAAAGVLLANPPDASALVDAVRPAVIEALARRAAADCVLVEMDGVEPPAALVAGYTLCEAECGPGRLMVDVTETDFVVALARLVERWIDAGWNDPLDQPTAVRFAHTMVDSQFYLPSRAEIMAEFEEKALIRLRGAANRLQVPPHDREDLVGDSYVEGRSRLMRVFIDSYVDPRLEPVDWDYEVRTATTLRDAQKLFVDWKVTQPSADLTATENSAHGGHAAPWEPQRMQPGDLDPVERDYWRNRDLHLTESPDYDDLITRTAGEREPWRSIDEIVWLAARLVDDAADELAIGLRPRTLNDVERALAKGWIEDRLEGTLRDGTRRVSRQWTEIRAKATLSALYPGVTIVDDVTADSPTEADVPSYRQIGLVVERAMHRAVVVVFGRRALDRGGWTLVDEDE